MLAVVVCLEHISSTDKRQINHQDVTKLSQPAQEINRVVVTLLLCHVSYYESCT